MIRNACVIVGLVLALGGCMQKDMPGESFAGTRGVATAEEHAREEKLREHVRVLSVEIGLRHVGEHANLVKAAAYVEDELKGMGYAVRSQEWDEGGRPVRNLDVTIEGKTRPKEIVVMGAHYDSARQSPGADDNGSGVAALLEIARMVKDNPQSRTVRLVFFVNEEPPYFGTSRMGSWQYARESKRKGEDIRAMIALDSLGRFSEEPQSQHYPAMLAKEFPDTANFVAFVSRTEDVGLVRDTVGAFREKTPVPSEGAALPGFLDGVGFSDHWSFWQFGYPAVMVSDTAFFRWREYHTPNDTMEQIDFLVLTRVTVGLRDVVVSLDEARSKK